MSERLQLTLVLAMPYRESMLEVPGHEVCGGKLTAVPG